MQSKPGPSTDILVRGRPNAQQIAGKDGGSKLIEVRRLAAQGIKVTVIGERQFWKLADEAVKEPAKKSAEMVQGVRLVERRAAVQAFKGSDSLQQPTNQPEPHSPRLVTAPCRLERHADVARQRPRFLCRARHVGEPRLEPDARSLRRSSRRLPSASTACSI